MNCLKIKEKPEKQITKIEDKYQELKIKESFDKETKRDLCLTRIKHKMNEDFLKLFIKFYKNSRKISYMTKFIIWTWAPKA